MNYYIKQIEDDIATDNGDLEDEDNLPQVVPLFDEPPLWIDKDGVIFVACEGMHYPGFAVAEDIKNNA